MRYGFILMLLVAAACAANPAPVPDYPASDDSMSVDTEMLGLDLEPRGEPAAPEAAEAPAEEPAAADAAE